MTATSLDTDISVLVGEMPDEPCDTPGHLMGLDIHDDGPATHYMMWHKPCECLEPTVVARCAQFVAFTALNRDMECGICAHKALAEDFYTLIGPIGIDS